MLVKFFPKGRCSLSYCLGTKVRGEDVRRPQVLVGDPKQTEEILKGIDFANPFTSVALTYERTISQEEASRDIASFEAMLLPGMSTDTELSRVWIRHLEFPKDPKTKQPDTNQAPRTALHCIIANVHLPTGKRVQPYFDRVDRRRVEAWQELTNIEHGFASPKDPERRRAISLDVNRLPSTARELKEAVNEAVIASINEETLRTREDLVAWFAEHGFAVERVTKQAISVSHPSLEKNLRFKGELYELGGIEGFFAAGNRREKPERRVREIGTDQCRRELQEGVERKRAELQSRFARRDEKSPRGLGEDHPSGEATMGSNDKRSRASLSRNAEENVDMGACGIADRGLGDGRHHGYPILGEREQGNGYSTEQPSADRGNQASRPTRTGGDSEQRLEISSEQPHGVEENDRGGGTPANRDTGQDGGLQKAFGTDNLPREERGGIRRDTTNGQGLRLGGPDHHCGEKEQVNHEPDPTESYADGIGFVEFLAEIVGRARAAADRFREAIEGVRRALRNQFVLRSAERSRLAQEARRVGLCCEFVIRADRNLAERSCVDENQLRQGDRRFQFDGRQVPDLIFGAAESQKLSRVIALSRAKIRSRAAIRSNSEVKRGIDRGNRISL